MLTKVKGSAGLIPTKMALINRVRTKLPARPILSPININRNVTFAQIDASDDNAIRVLIGLWAQKGRVGYSEHCGAGTNSQRYGWSCKHVRKEAFSQRLYRSSN